MNTQQKKASKPKEDGNWCTVGACSFFVPKGQKIIPPTKEEIMAKADQRKQWGY